MSGLLLVLGGTMAEILPLHKLRIRWLFDIFSRVSVSDRHILTGILSNWESLNYKLSTEEDLAKVEELYFRYLPQPGETDV